MIYYTKDGSKREFEIEEKDYIKSGTQGSVFRTSEDTCLKKYYNVDRSKLTIFDDSYSVFTEEVFEAIKGLENLEGYCKLYELLYNSDDFNKREVIAYTMKYYEQLGTSFLFLPMDYLLDSYKMIYDGVVSLTNKGIDIVDFNGSNIIQTEGGMTAIDFDKWRMSSRNFDERWLLNMDQLKYAFISMIEYELKDKIYKKGTWNSVKNDIDLELRKIFTKQTHPYVLARRLRGYSKPIDIIYRR